MNSQFSPFSSVISPGFWQKFSELMLDNSKVPERIPIWGYYGPTANPIELSLLRVDHSSFNENPSPSHNQVCVRGQIVLAKSVEHFKEIDKNALLAEFKLDLEEIEKNPANLAPFVLLIHADLKAYVYTYWFGFPAISSVKLSFSNLEPAPEAVVGILEGKSAEEIRKQGFFIVDLESGVKSLKEGGPGIYSYLDPSSSTNVPNWVLRNYAAYIIEKLKLESGVEIRIFSLRTTSGDMLDASRAFTLKVEFPEDWQTNPKVLGWERNKDKMTPRVVDLKSDLDPIALSESSVDFNLKLMKWNLFPEFDLEKMHDLKVCIMGAGTLGSNVARCLMGWGVRKIDIVDYGVVSYSNPVRQSVYMYTDAGKPKASTAAHNLAQIFPGVKAAGYKLQIPMPGHPTSVSTLEQTKKDCDKLDELVQKNDVIFILTDSREGRWAPTVLGAAYNKLVISTALGFDSYLVMRHGLEGEELGCYFCTDVVVPGDSTSDRTLDQQCTVSRPGVSMIAGAQAVELMVATLQNCETLGAPIHSMRGFLSSGIEFCPTFQNFKKCSACSKNIVEAYRKNKFEFIRRAMDDPGYLETVSGLDELALEVTENYGIVALDDDEISD